MKEKRTLMFLTGSRGEWGYIRPLIRLCEENTDFDYELCVTNMHLLPSFGSSVREIERDGFTIHHRLHMAFDGYSHVTMVKSLGVLIMSLADVVAARRPDWIVLAGDRGEQLAGAMVGAFNYIPIAHIQAGELSGNIDGMTRHAIGKYAHMHLCSNKNAFDRVIRLGEQPERVHNVGAPQLDEIVNGEVTSKTELAEKYKLDLSRDYLLVVQHPVTEDYAMASDQIRETILALNEMDRQKIVILPNNDAGSHLIQDGIQQHRDGNYHVISNLPRADYLGLLKNAACLIGNSSSGILEAPTFKVPVVNLGRRQAGRMQAENIINAEFSQATIKDALHEALAEAFQLKVRKTCQNPYGDGRSSRRILELFRSTVIDDELLTKVLTY